MKTQHIVLALVLCVIASAAMAEMDQAYLGATVVGTNTAIASAVVRGEVASVITYIPAGRTADVSVASSDGELIFAKTGLTGGTAGTTNVYPLLYPQYSSAAAALTWSYLANATGAVWTATNPIYGPLPLLGVVTATWTGQDITTNTCSIKLNYRK